MLAVGGLLHRLHRTGCGRLHGAVESELGLDIHGESDHVHRVLRGLYRAHMLRVHVVEGNASRGTRPGEPVRAGPTDYSGCGQHGAGRVSAYPGRKLHIHGVLQDDLLGDRVRRAARHALAPRAPVPVRAGRLLCILRRFGKRRTGKAAPAFGRQQVVAPAILYTPPIADAASQPLSPAAAPGGPEVAIRLWRQTVVRRDHPAGQRHGPGHVRRVYQRR